MRAGRSRSSSRKLSRSSPPRRATSRIIRRPPGTDGARRPLAVRDTHTARVGSTPLRSSTCDSPLANASDNKSVPVVTCLAIDAQVAKPFLDGVQMAERVGR